MGAVVTPDDLALGRRFAAGNEDAVREVYRRYGHLVYSVAFKILGDRPLAEDATQKTFVQAWKAAGRFDPSRSLESWLATIARRAAIDVYRHERRFRASELDDSVLVSMPPSAEQLSDIWDVRRALQLIPEQDRDLLKLHHFRGLTHAEIAVELAIPIGTVKSRSHRAHRRLAEYLDHLRPRDPAGRRGDLT